MYCVCVFGELMTTLDSRWGFTDGVPNRQGGGLLEQRLALSYQLALLKSTSLSSISSTTCLLFTPLCGKLNYIPPSRLSPPPLSRRLFPQSFCLHTHTHTCATGHGAAVPQSVDLIGQRLLAYLIHHILQECYNTWAVCIQYPVFF